MSPRAKSTQVSLLEDTSLERLWASQLSKLFVLLPPWGIGVVVLVAAVALHLAWGGRALAAAGVGAAGLALAVLTWHVTHQRGTLGRWHATGSVAAVAGWLAEAVYCGVTGPVVSYLAVVGGMTLAVSWNIRVVIRTRHPADHLAAAFEQAAEKAGLRGSRLQIRSRTGRKVEAVIVMPPGERTADDAMRRAPYLESGLRFPPGSLSIAPDLDQANRALVRISDPRMIRKPVPWPGPSRSGTSIALPLEPGVWQDGEPVRYVIVGHHLQVMGQTGSGKSIGAAWSLLAELVTRADCAVLAADLTKGDQTLGPFRPALHQFATGKDEARAMLAGVQASIRPRTDHLAAQGLQRWKEGCGLTYVVVWLEEAPDVLDALGDAGQDRWLKALKAARSAGITFVLSLQRSDWSQMPTLARGQLAKCCLGVESEHDAAFGLSQAQQDRGARPELWSNNVPGMAYLDAPGIPDDRLAMPWRTWFFGEDDKLIGEHAARWPASARPVDQLTLSAMGPAMTSSDADDGDRLDADDAADLVSQYAPAEDPSDTEPPPENIEVPDDEFGRWRFTTPAAAGRKPGPAEAREQLTALIGQWRAGGRKAFAIGDLAEFRAESGLSRPWLYKALAELADAALIERDDSAAGRWLIRP